MIDFAALGRAADALLHKDEVRLARPVLVPDGMGNQFDEAANQTDPAHEIHSRYVLTAADTPTAARLQADGWTVLYESDSGVLYER